MACDDMLRLNEGRILDQVPILLLFHAHHERLAGHPHACVVVSPQLARLLDHVVPGFCMAIIQLASHLHVLHLELLTIAILGKARIVALLHA